MDWTKRSTEIKDGSGGVVTREGFEESRLSERGETWGEWGGGEEESTGVGRQGLGRTGCEGFFGEMDRRELDRTIQRCLCC